jgi:hypothetical protein
MPFPPSIRLTRASDAAESYKELTSTQVNRMRKAGGGTIKVGGSSYTVTIQADGKVNVNPFRPRDSKVTTKVTTELKHLLMQRVGEELAREQKEAELQSKRTSTRVQSGKTLSSPEIMSFESQEDANIRLSGHAAYGFHYNARRDSNIRFMANVDGKEKPQGMTTIDVLNKYIGVKWYDEKDPRSYAETMRHNLSSSSVIEAHPIIEESSEEGFVSVTKDPPFSSVIEMVSDEEDYASVIKKSQNGEWQKMLSERLHDSPERFDMFERISVMQKIDRGESPHGATPTMIARVKANGLDTEIRELLLKNSPALNKELAELPPAARDQRLDELVSEAKSLAAKSREKRLESLSINDARDAKPKNGIFREASMTHYFRQTSKLGLTFFKEQGIPVDFWMQMPDKSTVTSTDTLTAQGRVDRRLAGYSEAITLSEMREVQRLAAKEEAGHIHFVASMPAPAPST